MAIDTYDKLCKAIVTYAKRDDILSLIPDFISSAEQHMYDNETESLQLRSMEVVSETLSTGRFVELPNSFESSRATRIMDDAGELRYRTPEAMRRSPTTGRPSFFTIIGNTIEFNCTPDSEYTIELQYFRRLNPLTEDNQTNEILTTHSNIYLFGALYELAVYEQDFDMMQLYEKRFYNAIKGANRTDKRGRYGNAPAMNLDNGMMP